MSVYVPDWEYRSDGTYTVLYEKNEPIMTHFTFFFHKCLYMYVYIHHTHAPLFAFSLFFSFLFAFFFFFFSSLYFFLFDHIFFMTIHIQLDSSPAYVDIRLQFIPDERKPDNLLYACITTHPESFYPDKSNKCYCQIFRYSIKYHVTSKI